MEYFVCKKKRKRKTTNKAVTLFKVSHNAARLLSVANSAHFVFCGANFEDILEVHPILSKTSEIYFPSCHESCNIDCNQNQV